MIAPRPVTALLRASTYRRPRWKNGGGETMEIAISPAGASLDTFDWRISMATVASDGPFSIFAGVDRTLCILDGAGIELHLADASARQLDGASAPFSFSGDVAADARLMNGTVTDFNVMTRRARFGHSVERIRLQTGERRDVHSGIRAIFCQTGVVSIEGTGTAAPHERLEPRDTMLRHEPRGGAWILLADSAATVCLVTILEIGA